MKFRVYLVVFLCLAGAVGAATPYTVTQSQKQYTVKKYTPKTYSPRQYSSQTQITPPKQLNSKQPRYVAPPEKPPQRMTPRSSGGGMPY
jgi:hypothetical protein